MSPLGLAVRRWSEEKNPELTGTGLVTRYVLRLLSRMPRAYRKRWRGLAYWHELIQLLLYNRCRHTQQPGWFTKFALCKRERTGTWSVQCRTAPRSAFFFFLSGTDQRWFQFPATAGPTDSFPCFSCRSNTVFFWLILQLSLSLPSALCKSEKSLSLSLSLSQFNSDVSA